MDEEENIAFITELIEREKDDLLTEFKEYKAAMEFYIGRNRVLEALEQYRNEVIKTGR